MPKILILADDLTGANDTGAAIHKLGFETYTVVDGGNGGSEFKNYACVSVNLDSRRMLAEEAARVVQTAARYYSTPDTKLFVKRIDSTLRGNLGSECDAFLKEMGDSAVAIVVPAFPRAGRIYHNEKIYVNGVELAQTAVSNDPMWPIKTSSPADILGQQTEKPLFHVPIDVVRAGENAVGQYASEAIAQGYKYILFESITDEDIHTVAGGIVSIGNPFIAVDPGPFTAAVAGRLFPHGESTEILAVVGSINAVSKEQVRLLMANKNVVFSQMDVACLLRDNEARQAEIKRAASELSAQDPDDGLRLLLLSSVLGQEQISFADYAKKNEAAQTETSVLISDALGAAACQVIQCCEKIGGLFTCGGDVTVSVCNNLGADGMRVLSEVIPLAVCGELTANNQKRYLIVTKGGMVGEPHEMIDCLEYLAQKLYTKERF